MQPSVSSQIVVPVLLEEISTYFGMFVAAFMRMLQVQIRMQDFLQELDTSTFLKNINSNILGRYHEFTIKLSRNIISDC